MLMQWGSLRAVVMRCRSRLSRVTGPRLSAPRLTQMASASESQAGAAPLPTLAAMRGWGVSEVANWAKTIHDITPQHADILVENEIKGADLLDRVTQADLERWGMAGGPAGRIMSALAADKPVEAAVPASMGE